MERKLLMDSIMLEEHDNLINELFREVSKSKSAEMLLGFTRYITTIDAFITRVIDGDKYQDTVVGLSVGIEGKSKFVMSIKNMLSKYSDVMKEEDITKLMQFISGTLIHLADLNSSLDIITFDDRTIGQLVEDNKLKINSTKSKKIKSNSSGKLFEGIDLDIKDSRIMEDNAIYRVVVEDKSCGTLAEEIVTDLNSLELEEDAKFDAMENLLSFYALLDGYASMLKILVNIGVETISNFTVELYENDKFDNLLLSTDYKSLIKEDVFIKGNSEEYNVDIQKMLLVLSDTKYLKDRASAETMSIKINGLTYQEQTERVANITVELQEKLTNKSKTKVKEDILFS